MRALKHVAEDVEHEEKLTRADDDAVGWKEARGEHEACAERDVELHAQRSIEADEASVGGAHHDASIAQHERAAACAAERVTTCGDDVVRPALHDDSVARDEQQLSRGEHAGAHAQGGHLFA